MVILRGYSAHVCNADSRNPAGSPPRTAINWLNRGETSLTSTPFSHAPFVDVNGDGQCTPIDALLVVNWLNARSTGTPAGEGEAEDAIFSEIGGDSSEDDSMLALLALDDYHSGRRK